MTDVEWPQFLYDFRSPEAWLTAERIVHDLGAVPEFVPVDLDGLAAAGVPRTPDPEALAERARAYGLLAPRLPATYPPREARFALLAATYAKQIGKIVAFSHALFRQTFAAGRDLADIDTVYLAGAAAEIHPAALEKGAGLRGTAERLRVATEAAAAAGVRDVPAVLTPFGAQVFHGDDAVAAAAAALVGPDRAP